MHDLKQVTVAELRRRLLCAKCEDLSLRWANELIRETLAKPIELQQHTAETAINLLQAKVVSQIAKLTMTQDRIKQQIAKRRTMKK